MWLRGVNHCPHTDIFLAAREQRLQGFNYLHAGRVGRSRRAHV